MILYLELLAIAYYSVAIGVLIREKNFLEKLVKKS